MQGYNFDFYKVLKMQNKRLPTEYIIFWSIYVVHPSYKLLC